MKTLIEPTREIPIVAEGDVVILGGGPAGTSAAIGAADAGAKVILIERYGWLGGQATGGYVIGLYGNSDGKNVIVRGFHEELLGRLNALGALRGLIVQPEYLKYTLARCISERGILLRLHAWAVNAIIENGNITTVVTESKSGREAISGRVFIDATGDADMAEWSGVPYATLPKGVEPFPMRWGLGVAIQKDQLYPVTLCYRLGNIDIEKAKEFRADPACTALLERAEREALFRPVWTEGLNPNEVITDDIHLSADPCSAVDLSQAEVDGRRRIIAALAFYRKHYPGFENACLVDTAPQIGVRESRRIRGQAYLTTADLARDTNPDSIARALTGRKGRSCPIPYGCLVPPGIPNLLFAGRCISVEHGIIDRIRLIATCMATGQAAGIAASLALKHDGDVNKVAITELHKVLRAQNCIF